MPRSPEHAARWLVTLVAAFWLALGASSQDTPEPPEPPETEAAQPGDDAETEQDTAPQPVAAVESSDAQETQDVAAQRAEDGSSNESTDIWLVWLTLVLAIATTALVVTSSVQGYYASKAAKLMQAQIGVAQQTAEAAISSAKVAERTAAAYQTTERAWVSIEKFNSSRVAESTLNGQPFDGYRFYITWRNSGRTPAVQMEAFMDHRILRGEERDILPTFAPLRGGVQRTTTVSPGAGGHGVARFISSADISALERNECRIFLYGRTEYGDIFHPVRRYAEVCVEVEHVGRRTDNGELVFGYSVIGPQNGAD